MTGRQLLGWTILASPFVAVFVFVAALHGLLAAIGIFAAVAVVTALIRVGAEMVA